MAQSRDLATETGAMRRVEAAFAYVDQLPEKAKARVMRWAAEVHLRADDEAAEK
jgi:DNA topoisomerase VI subunit B